jgi:Tfp pilus assembly protein PilF
MGAQEKAILSLQAIVRLDPDNPLAHLRLAMALRLADRLEESVDHFRRAADLDPEHHLYRLRYARALFDVLRYDEARWEVETVLARAPVDAPERAAAQNLLGLVKGESSEKGRRAAVTEGITSSGLDPVQSKRWALIRERAWQLMRAGRYAEAEPVLRDTLALMPRDYKAYYDLGLTLMELGRYSEAIEAFRDGIRISRFGEWYPDSLFRIGLCLARQGRWSEAVRRFERVLEIQDWRNEDGYGMTFPDLGAVHDALAEARLHLPSPESLDAGEPLDPAIELIRPRSETAPVPALDPSPLMSEAIPLPSQVAILGMGDAQGWFRQIVPARGVVQDDLPTGLQEFIPIGPTDTFTPDDPEIILVYTLTSVPYDEITVTARWVIERAGPTSPNTVIGIERALLTLNDQSGYTRLRRPKDGWPVGLYRVEFYVGDQVDAYTHTAEARFRVVEKVAP